VDADGDGYGSNNDPGTSLCQDPGAGFSTNNGDCDDANAGRNPGEAEICNGIDDDCDGIADDGLVFTTYYVDADRDGYGSSQDFSLKLCSNPGPGFATNNLDCNDNNAAVHPGAVEICNSIDDDCDGFVDDSIPLTRYYVDADHDGFGSSSNPGTLRCSNPGAGFATNNLDCNDGNAAIRPTATEICNGIDDDCDGVIDDGLVVVNYYTDADGDGFGSVNSPVFPRCSNPGAGYSTNNTDCNDGNSNIRPGATEFCNGIDDDCDGVVDDGLTFSTYYVDNDGDGYGSTTPAGTFCANPGPGFSAVNTDCNDNNAAVHPGATEIRTNGIDDDCDGRIDEAGGGCSKPAKPTWINGPLFRSCLGPTSVYYIDPVPGATSYEWAVSGKAEIISGQGTTTVTIQFPPAKSTNTKINVKAINVCGASQTMSITVNTNNNFCRNAVKTPTSQGPAAENRRVAEQHDVKVFEVLVFPNPSQGPVTVSFSTKNEFQNVSLRLMDMQGKQVITKNVIVSNNESIKLDLNILPQGIYFLEAVSDDARKVIKVVKN
jgi:hypothetical protein